MLRSTYYSQNYASIIYQGLAAQDGQPHLNPKFSLYSNTCTFVYRLKTTNQPTKQTNKQTNTSQQLFTYMWYKKPSGLLRFCMLQPIKNWSRGRPGNKASLNPKISLYTDLKTKQTNTQTNKHTNKQTTQHSSCLHT